MRLHEFGSASGSLDLPTAMTRLGCDAELIAELVGVFLVDGPKLVARLRDAIDQNNTAAMTSAARALRGSAAIFALERLAHLASKLESLALESSGGEARAVCKEAALEMERTARALTASLKRNSAAVSS